MNLELKSPANERMGIHIPDEVSNLSLPFNGSFATTDGDEYRVKNNMAGKSKLNEQLLERAKEHIFS